MDEVRPGNAWNEPHDAAVRVLAQGMLDLKLLPGTLDDVLEKEAYKRFYMHRTGHWLGLDVHDAGDYKRAGEWRALEPGMALTVEPGLYIRAADDVPEPLRDIGVRIEDDVLVTGARLRGDHRRSAEGVADVEALMRDARVARIDVLIRGAGPVGCALARPARRHLKVAFLGGARAAGAIPPDRAVACQPPDPRAARRLGGLAADADRDDPRLAARRFGRTVLAPPTPAYRRSATWPSMPTCCPAAEPSPMSR